MGPSGSFEVPMWLTGGFVTVFFGFVLTVMVVMVALRWRAARRQGLDPVAGDIQLMGQVSRSAMLAPDRPVAERLAELDRLLQQRAITPEEHAAQRARILGAL
jgi:hypothetical protein